MGGSEAARLNIKNKGQTIIMLCGLQGNVKTTHTAKLAKYFIKQGRRPMLVAWYRTDAPAFRITKFTLLGLPPNYGVRHFCLFILYFWRKHTWRPPKGL